MKARIPKSKPLTVLHTEEAEYYTDKPLKEIKTEEDFFAEIEFVKKNHPENVVMLDGAVR